MSRSQLTTIKFKICTLRETIEVFSAGFTVSRTAISDHDNN